LPGPVRICFRAPMFRLAAAKRLRLQRKGRRYASSYTWRLADWPGEVAIPQATQNGQRHWQRPSQLVANEIRGEGQVVSFALHVWLTLAPKNDKRSRLCLAICPRGIAQLYRGRISAEPGENGRGL